jgi:hypothetical protein
MSFLWPDIIPSGQRSFTSDTGLIRKNISAISLLSPSGEKFDLFSELDVMSENDRKSLIVGAIGVFSGIKNILYAGFVLSSALNSSELLSPRVIENEGKYKGYTLSIEWASNKQDVKVLVGDLMDMVFLLSRTLYKSLADKPKWENNDP